MEIEHGRLRDNKFSLNKSRDQYLIAHILTENRSQLDF